MAQVCNLTKLYQNNFVLFYFLTIYKCHPAFFGEKICFSTCRYRKILLYATYKWIYMFPGKFYKVFILIFLGFS